MDIEKKLARAYRKAFTEVLHLHGRIYIGSGGRVGHRLLGVPNLIVETVGAKSGEPRSTVLTYASDGDDYVVVASAGGAPRNPAWYHNIRAAGEVGLRVGTRRMRARVTTLVPGDDGYARLFELADRANRGRYSQYQTMTRRPIPVCVLSPVGTRGQAEPSART
ncbi:nitroreductase family deazaflavin-dependent oxidoreductase [Tsukamurella sp. 8F]|uniref:nitroreductase family deazaflavin-dependent oxidoreductase n=1 Tax=unclassified Tsukamurella TaxID=2633480 RepID=UPI0023B9850D|nr:MULTISPECIES: nitroreductase family deazaflavin-dependent oxidoreductase [unclassified Tsukamurella]MDF0530541.1 nitroreductase family deazaflavin-dependent oxidoreductase [Tsukamurella sp. 8J]MDF0586809.1 nitroreductase family deazaflavin-dependent oxidoreductase [Tsukamurella sp. 8F]